MVGYAEDRVASALELMAAFHRADTRGWRVREMTDSVCLFERGATSALALRMWPNGHVAIGRVSEGEAVPGGWYWHEPPPTMDDSRWIRLTGTQEASLCNHCRPLFGGVPKE